MSKIELLAQSRETKSSARVFTPGESSGRGSPQGNNDTLVWGAGTDPSGHGSQPAPFSGLRGHHLLVCPHSRKHLACFEQQDKTEVTHFYPPPPLPFTSRNKQHSHLN